ncbi:hypothetical protein V2J09_016346 [Rumex salicifolius]
MIRTKNRGRSRVGSSGIGKFVQDEVNDQRVGSATRGGVGSEANGKSTVLGEVDIFGHPTVDLPRSDSMENLIHELFNETTHHHGSCTHVHTCNPPGPDNSHTHTCFHVHTKLVPAAPKVDANTNDDDEDESAESLDKKRPKKGNREAVRKYREKKKARAALLEDEIFRLKAVNQHLVQRLRGQAALEAEVARLKCLLVDLRARIQGEISSFFPYQMSGKSVVDVADPGSYLAKHKFNKNITPRQHPIHTIKSCGGCYSSLKHIKDINIVDADCTGRLLDGLLDDRDRGLGIGVSKGEDEGRNKCRFGNELDLME